MTRSPDSLVSSTAEQSEVEKRDDKAFKCRQEGEANLRAATEVNAGTASLTPPVIMPIQLELFPGRACSPETKPDTIRSTAGTNPNRRDGVWGGGTQRQIIQLTSRAGSRKWPQYRGSPGQPGGGKGRYFHQANETGKGIRTAPAREGSTPDPSSQAHRARETRPCPQTATDAIPSGQTAIEKEVHTSLR